MKKEECIHTLLASYGANRSMWNNAADRAGIDRGAIINTIRNARTPAGSIELLRLMTGRKAIEELNEPSDCSVVAINEILRIYDNTPIPEVLHKVSCIKSILHLIQHNTELLSKLLSYVEWEENWTPATFLAVHDMDALRTFLGLLSDAQKAFVVDQAWNDLNHPIISLFERGYVDEARAVAQLLGVSIEYLQEEYKPYNESELYEEETDEDSDELESEKSEFEDRDSESVPESPAPENTLGLLGGIPDQAE